MKVTVFDKENEKLDFVRKYYPNIEAFNVEIVESNYKKLLNFLKEGDLQRFSKKCSFFMKMFFS